MTPEEQLIRRYSTWRTVSSQFVAWMECLLPRFPQRPGAGRRLRRIERVGNRETKGVCKHEDRAGKQPVHLPELSSAAARSLHGRWM